MKNLIVINFYDKKKIFEPKFFKKQIIQLLNSYFHKILNTKNENYMKVWQFWLCPKLSGKHLKLSWADSTPPTLFRIKIKNLKDFVMFR